MIPRRLSKSFALLVAAATLLAPSVLAQRGDRKGHDNQESIVPADRIPPAPVLSVDEALEKFVLAPGFVIEPVVAEPLVEMPVALKFDADGRMWVCEMKGYMPDIDGKGEDKPQGRIVVLEDTDNDGTVDKRTVFLDKILLPRALHVTSDGLLFADQSSLYFVGRNGVEPSGDPVIVDKDYAASGNVEHKSNGLLPGLDNWLYNAKSGSRYRRVNDRWIEKPTHFRGQWGISKDDFGRLYYNSNSTILQGEFLLPRTLDGNPGARMRMSVGPRLTSNRVWPARITPGLNRAYISSLNGYGSDTIDPKTFKLINTTAACGPEIYRGDNFPDLGSPVAFVAESSANLIKAVSIHEENGSLRGEHVYEESEFLASTDERFRPVSLYTAPDGCLYILDMYHGIIQHKTYVTSYLREYILDQGLDKPGEGMGRIYRVRYQANPRGPQPQLSEATTAELVEALRHPNGWWRDTAQQLLIERRPQDALPLLQKALSDPDHPRAQLHALWTIEGMDALNRRHLEWSLKQDENPHLVATALTAAVSLSYPSLAALEEAIIAAPATGELAVYRNRALAEIATPSALRAAIDTMNERKKQAFLREATMAGLVGHEDAFATASKDRFKDQDFAKWLASSRKAATPADRPKLDPDHLAAFEKGKSHFTTTAACIGCHGPNGEGLDNLGPPLDGSEWVTGSEERLVKILLHGMQGPLTVAGEKYDPPAPMPGLGMNPTLDDEAIAAIATYVRHAWENRAPMVKAETVKQIRAKTSSQAGRPYEAKDLQ